MKRAGVGIAVGAAVLTIYLLRLDAAAGLYVDDAWYIVLAKALWQGDGFRLISSATTPILPAFPPGFAMLLAPVVGMTADFPDNVSALKAVSIVAMAGVGICSYVFLWRFSSVPQHVAAVIAVITTLIPAFVFLTTSTVMADPTFTLSQIALAIAIERSVAARDPAHHRRLIVISAAIGAALLLVRVAGVAAIAASVLYLVWRRGVRAAAIFGVIVIIGYSPWLLYSRANAPTIPERDAHGGSVAFRYSELLMMRYGGEPSSGRVTIGELPSRIGNNIVNVLGRDAGAFVFPGGYRGASESGQEAFVLSGEPVCARRAWAAPRRSSGCRRSSAWPSSLASTSPCANASRSPSASSCSPWPWSCACRRERIATCRPLRPSCCCTSSPGSTPSRRAVAARSVRHSGSLLQLC
jgi:hypothetical protein